MTMKMKVLVFREGCNPAAEEIDGSLKSMQKIVGGNIECYQPNEEFCVICDEEGRFKHQWPNRDIMTEDYRLRQRIYGDFFVCGAGEEDFVGLTDKQIQTLLDKCRRGPIAIG